MKIGPKICLSKELEISNYKSAFTSYSIVNEGDEQVFMGNSRMSPMIGNGIFSLS